MAASFTNNGVVDPVECMKILQPALDSIVKQTAVTQFNSHLLAFLIRLRDIYRLIPELSHEIDNRRKVIDDMITRDDTYVIQQFYKFVSPHVPEGLDDTQRENFIAVILPQISLLRSLQISNYWHRTSEQTKQSIWEYIKRLWTHAREYNTQLVTPSLSQLNEVASKLMSMPLIGGLIQQAQLLAQGLTIDPAMHPGGSGSSGGGDSGRNAHTENEREFMDE